MKTDYVTEIFFGCIYFSNFVFVYWINSCLSFGICFISFPFIPCIHFQALKKLVSAVTSQKPEGSSSGASSSSSSSAPVNNISHLVKRKRKIDEIAEQKEEIEESPAKKPNAWTMILRCFFCVCVSGFTRFPFWLNLFKNTVFVYSCNVHFSRVLFLIQYIFLLVLLIHCLIN